MSIFDSLSLLPQDPIFSLNVDFAEEKRPNKVNLGVGSYKTAEGKPLVLSAVHKAEMLLLERQENKEYLPLDGLPSYIQETLKFVYGEHSLPLKEGRICGVQTVGGAGALSLGGTLLSEGISRRLYASTPTWANHKAIFNRTGLKFDLYPYLDAINYQVDVKRMCEAIRKMEPQDTVLLHSCCHNPTGIDPTFEQWQQISEAIKASRVIPFFDLAYAGFGQGLEKDLQALRYFVDQGHEMLVASSYSKNFGLYGERIGLLSAVSHNKGNLTPILSHLKALVRSAYSNPPSHGALIVATILNSQPLKQEWENELKNMRERIVEMRKAFVTELMSKENSKDFSFMSRQHGMFSYTGLNQDQVRRLREENAIYMPADGRVNVAGLNWHNLKYVVESILAVL